MLSIRELPIKLTSLLSFIKKDVLMASALTDNKITGSTWKIPGVSYISKVTNKNELIHKLEWILKITVAMCFIGHGFWGTVSKPGWVELITPFGFSQSFASGSLPWIGWVDISLGILILIRPCRAWLWYAFLWTVLTATLRPIAGMSFFEVPERAGNFGIPLAFLVLVAGMCNSQSFFGKIKLRKIDPNLLSDRRLRTVKLILQCSIGLLLIGHGGLVAITQKEMYVHHMAVLNITATPAILQIVGWFEILLGLFVTIKPNIKLLWFIFFWKIFTESLYPFAGNLVDVFETIERWGDYGGPLALMLILYFKNAKNIELKVNSYNAQSDIAESRMERVPFNSTMVTL